MKRLLPPRSLLSLLILLGCGVTVGNSGPPPVAPDTAFVTLVGMEHDEVMNSVFDQNVNDASPELAFRAVPSETVTCTEDPSGSILVERAEQSEVEFETGRLVKRRVVTDSVERSWNTKLSLTNGTGSLRCLANNRPVITWAQLINLKSEEKVTKVRNRNVVLKADNSVLSQTKLNVVSTREHVFSKVSLTLGTLVANKTSSFESTVQLQKDGEEASIERTIKTLPNEPLVLQKTLVRGSGLTAAKIVSGAVSSVNGDKRKVVLRYKDLELSTGSSCHPTSGSITGEIYAEESATTPESSFILKFTEDGAVLVSANGSEADLELESCQL